MFKPKGHEIGMAYEYLIDVIELVITLEILRNYERLSFYIVFECSRTIAVCWLIMFQDI